MKIHLFNPENDLALAADTRRYTPPRAALAVKRAGALLPLWWADDDDILLADDFDPGELQRLRDYGLKAAVSSAVHAVEIDSAEPWGWSRDAVRQLSEAGVSPDILPGDTTLERYRMLSHRRTALRLRQMLGESDADLPVEAHTSAEAMQAIRSFGGDAYIKQPWSGSGRGVFHTTQLSAETLLRYIEGFLRTQGSVMVERARAKITDFAMLYHASDSGTVDFRGYSAFSTDARGAYQGNIVAPQTVLQQLIGVDARHLEIPVAEALSQIISGTGYSGWIGVDMLTYSAPSGELLIQPAVEINFRRTMGVAALEIRHRLDTLSARGKRKGADPRVLPLNPRLFRFLD